MGLGANRLKKILTYSRSLDTPKLSTIKTDIESLKIKTVGGSIQFPCSSYSDWLPYPYVSIVASMFLALVNLVLETLIDCKVR